MKKLACRLGRHDWKMRVEGGEEYRVCAACGKSPHESRRSGAYLKQNLGGGVDEPYEGIRRDFGGGGGDT